MAAYSFTVNGRVRTVESSDPDLPLLYVLRNGLDLTGPKFGCGLVINPDTVSQQVEGNILQTLSRALFEEVAFDKAKVTSLDWASYPILASPEVPDVKIDLVMRRELPPLGAGEAAAAPVAAALANGVGA